jgi:hypothetical protein
LLCRTRAITNNDLRANEGRETKALNCKPNTNLNEISELSNYCKTSGFRLHAVIASGSHHGLLNTSNCNAQHHVRSPFCHALKVLVTQRSTQWS